MPVPVPRKTPSDCPIERCIGVLSGRWKAMVIWRLRTGPQRFSELFHDIPHVQERVLSQVLRGLSDDGLIEKSEGGAWSLTPEGRRLDPVLAAMFEWSAGAPAGEFAKA